MSDFSEISTMDIDSKIHILEFFGNFRDMDGLSEKEAIISAKIISERLSNPGFIFPDELNPSNWHKVNKSLI
ncbi:MAG: hypothetical protein HFJ41_04710 [Clostridia bacterium]|nr:hypothetical protein [Clostridia bacterium]